MRISYILDFPLENIEADYSDEYTEPNGVEGTFNGSFFLILNDTRKKSVYIRILITETDYLLNYNLQTTWYTAGEICKQRGMELLWIETMDEWQFVVDFLRKGNKIFRSNQAKI